MRAWEGGTGLESLEDVAVRRVFRSRALKRQIVEDTLEPGASVSRVARKYGVTANQVFGWRLLYQQGKLELRSKDLVEVPNPANAHVPDAVPALLPVQLVDALPVRPGAVAHGDAAGVSAHSESPQAHPPVGLLAAGSMHVELGQARVRIDGAADAATLRTLIACLRGIER